MIYNQKEVQQQYEGFLNTPQLWENNSIFELSQLCLNTLKTTRFSQNITTKLRLGKLVERFVSHQLTQNNTVKILAENIQIQNDKLTIGELDCLLLQHNMSTHVEIVYKFYLYDKSSAKSSEIDCWIGPNRKDSLVEKLIKLKEKQLPLLYHNKTLPYLQKLNISPQNIVQKVYFKAQLFVPLENVNDTFKLINNNCIYGFYIYPNQLNQFRNCKFYIPNKHNWLTTPFSDVCWLLYDNFKEKLTAYLTEKNAPLCWGKKSNGEMFKFFVVWW